ncbi:MAG: efflux RND transporter periplasmic adaptor subunit [Kofleriaceae bacterium]
MNDQLSHDLASLKIDRSPKRPRRSLTGTLLIVALLAGGVAAVYFLVVPRLKAVLTTQELKTGEISMVSPAQGQVRLTATGYVVALVSAKVAAKVPGRIAEIFVEEGSVIAQGDKVARLEDVDHKSAIASARARAASARARVQIAKANVAELEVTLKRDTPLADRGVIPRSGVDDMIARVASLRASVKAAEAEAAAADAESRSLEIQLGSYLIISPIAGTVVDKLVEVGEGVAPGFGTPGVVEVVDMMSLVVEVDVPESKLDQVAEGNPAEIILDAYSSRRLGGKVKEVGRRVNRAKATVPVKIAFDNLRELTSTAKAPASATGSGPVPQAMAGSGAVPPAMAGSGTAGEKPLVILPEMAARVSFLEEPISDQARKAPPKLVVPANAVVQRGGGDVVFVFNDGYVRQTNVKVGQPFAGGRELETPLPAGTKVVLDPPADLTDGKKVKEKT